MKDLRILAPAVLLLAVAACAPESQDREGSEPASTRPALTDRDWQLVGLGDQANPLGAGGRPLTLRLDSASKRASGFAGCNRYGAAYNLTTDSLRFGPMMSTKMACADGDEVEGRFLAALAAVRTYEVRDGELVLGAAGVSLARLRNP
jgi:heat shock protein HslJ